MTENRITEKKTRALQRWQELAFRNCETDWAVNELLERIAGEKYDDYEELDDPIVEIIDRLTEEELDAFIAEAKKIDQEDKKSDSKEETKMANKAETRIIIDARREGYGPDQIDRTMTVGELIEALQEYDEDAKIYLSHDRGYTYGGITAARITEEWIEEDEEDDEEPEED